MRLACAALPLLLCACTSTYAISTLEVRRHQGELRRDGEADVVDRSGDHLTLALDDETPWGESVEHLLRGCGRPPTVRWRPGHTAGDRGEPSCRLDDEDSLHIERTDPVTTVLGGALALGIVGTLVGCTAACKSEPLQLASGIALFLIPLGALPLFFLGGSANAFGTVH